MEIKDQATIAKDDDDLTLRILCKVGSREYPADIDTETSEDGTVSTVYTIWPAEEQNAECMLRIIAPEDAPRQDVLAAAGFRLLEHPVLTEFIFSQFRYDTEADDVTACFSFYDLEIDNSRVYMLSIKDDDLFYTLELTGSKGLREDITRDFLNGELQKIIASSNMTQLPMVLRQKYRCETSLIEGDPYA